MTTISLGTLGGYRIDKKYMLIYGDKYYIHHIDTLKDNPVTTFEFDNHDINPQFISLPVATTNYIYWMIIDLCQKVHALTIHFLGEITLKKNIRVADYNNMLISMHHIRYQSFVLYYADVDKNIKQQRFEYNFYASSNRNIISNVINVDDDDTVKSATKIEYI